MTNEDQSLWLVFNGEIYNFRELRQELMAKGHPFKTSSDTETILHLYEEMGPDCVQRLRGMFAFSLWDKRRNRLLLARDRVGKKPLVYSLKNGRLAWASEIRPLLQLPDISRELDFQALDLYLGLQYIPSPWTIYKDIRKLPPGHRMIVENGQIRVERYWNLPLDKPALSLSFQEAKEAIREKLKESTRLRMIADVPLGVFLSGGVDSSVVAALMSELSDRPVKTFSIGFEEQEFSELDYAREVAQRYGTQHTEFIVKPEMADVLPLLARHYGEPFGDSSALATYYVSRETRRHVTVALNGDGGDENFAGYRRYTAMKAARYFGCLPRPLRAGLRHGMDKMSQKTFSPVLANRIRRFAECTFQPDRVSQYFNLLGYFTEEEKRALYTPGFMANVKAGESLRYLDKHFQAAESQDFVNRMLYVDFYTYLPECLMVKVDIATMANSLEGRSPLLDHELLELVFQLPGDWKLKGLTGLKWIFRQAMREDLPPRVYRREKMGFGIPLGPWFRGKLKEYWQDHVLSSQALARGYFQKNFLDQLFEEHVSRRRDHGYKLWILLMLELWHQASSA
jgi:asparagine synthase (glutamine-hydrolysing)